MLIFISAFYLVSCFRLLFAAGILTQYFYLLITVWPLTDLGRDSKRSFLPSPHSVCIREARLCRVSIEIIALKYLQRLVWLSSSSLSSTSDEKVRKCF